jgi:3-deoxy-D-manno-octulosonic-acid transferase
LEAAAFSKPVIFGPRHKKFREAVELISLGGGFAVSNGEEFDRIAGKLLSNDDYLKEVSGIAGNYVAGNTGATELILSELRRGVL